MDISETDRAYLAGILDGEGNLNLICTERCFQVNVFVANNAPEIHKWLSEKFGGMTRDSYTSRTKCMRTEWNNRQAIKTLLEAAYPYLLIKRLEAGILLLYVNGSNGRGQAHDLSEEKILELAMLMKIEHWKRRTEKEVM